MYCSNCGKELNENAAVCLGCGVTVNKQPQESSVHVSAGWWWLGFFIPLAGLLIWVFCNDSEPQKAKKAGTGALVGVIVSVVLVILWYVLVFGLIMLPFFLYDSPAYYL